MCALNARTLPSGRPGGRGRGRWIGRGSSVDGVVACPPRRARSPRVHGSNAPNCRCVKDRPDSKQAGGDKNTGYDKSRFAALMRVLRPVCSRRRLDTMLLRLHLLGTIRNKATNGACPHATLSEVLMSDSHAHSPCRQHACAHAPSGRMQSSGTGLPLLPRFPMWNRDSLHARNSRVLSWTSITR